MSRENGNDINPKIRLIIDCTLEVLRDHGEKGFSMRKVAAKAGMSLGNLQFYFKNKDELLKGMVDVYFKGCEADFNASFMEQAHGDRRETITFLVNFGMDYAHSDIGAVFRELWAMAAKNEEIRKQLHEYYRIYANQLAEILGPFARTPDSIPKVVTLLIPYFEGRGLVTSPLPAGKEDMTEFITEIIDSALKGD